MMFLLLKQFIPFGGSNGKLSTPLSTFSIKLFKNVYLSLKKKRIDNILTFERDKDTYLSSQYLAKLSRLTLIKLQ